MHAAIAAGGAGLITKRAINRDWATNKISAPLRQRAWLGLFTEANVLVFMRFQLFYKSYNVPVGRFFTAMTGALVMLVAFSRGIVVELHSKESRLRYCCSANQMLNSASEFKLFLCDTTSNFLHTNTGHGTNLSKTTSLCGSCYSCILLPQIYSCL